MGGDGRREALGGVGDVGEDYSRSVAEDDLQRIEPADVHHPEEDRAEADGLPGLQLLLEGGEEEATEEEFLRYADEEAQHQEVVPHRLDEGRSDEDGAGAQDAVLD